MIFYIAIQKNFSYILQHLHCIFIITKLLHCNSIRIFKKICVLFTIKLNVLLVNCKCFFSPRGVMSKLDSGGRGEAVVRALVPHQCGFGFAQDLGPRSHSCAADEFPVTWSQRVLEFFLPAVRTSSQKCIDREGLGRSRTEVQILVHLCTPYVGQSWLISRTHQ